MTTRKHSEGAFVGLAKRYGWGWHKYGDVRYCVHCHKPLPKTERAPDYMLAPVYTWVECKNGNASGRWSWKDDIGPEGNRKNQREWLQEHGGWLYIELGLGHAPMGRGAFLVPWKSWIDKVEPQLLANSQYSLCFTSTGRGKSQRQGADVFLAEFRLEWIEGGWSIPRKHVFWISLYTVLTNKLSTL